MRSGTRGIGTAGLLLALVATACAGRMPACPAAGGPAWTELQAPHFRLRTDGDVAAARATLTALEQFQAALLTVFGARADLDTGRLPVVVVDRGWTDFAPRMVSGYFIHALFQPLIVMPSGNELFQQEVIKHELVHYFSRMVMPRQPVWLAEGLASYYQTIEYDPDAGRITVGRPPSDLLRIAQRMGVSNFVSMFEAEAIGDDVGRFYASAWVTIHYLMNHRVEALAGYEKALHDGATPEAAWAAAFGVQTPADLAAEVRQYVDGGQYALLLYRFAAPSLPAPRERRMTDAETHATRALLYLTGSRTRVHAPASIDVANPRVEASAEVDEALRQEPDHVAARAISHFMLGRSIELQQATVVSQKHAGDWLAWLLLVEALRARHDNAADALGRAIDIASTDRSVTLP